MELVPLVLWFLLYALLAGAGLPLASRLLAPLPTRGAGFALPVALVVLTSVGYWVGHVSFDVAPVVALLVLLALSAAAGLDLDALRERRLELADDLAFDRSAAVDSAVVFVVAFTFLVVVRAADPAVHAGGGEKFLDFGLLQSLMLSPTLPPEDMWFAGEPVRYYYGGHLTTALVAKLSGVAPAYAYNLSLAGFYAMLVTAAFDLAGAINVSRGGRRRIAGVFAAFFVGFASNLVTAGRFVLLALPEPLRTQVAGYVAEQSQYSASELLAGASSFSYWSASRVIPGTINEFPLFAWLNGDLHAHMMGTAFLLLGAAICYSYVLAPAANHRRRWGLVFVALPVLGSFQVYTDTWSFPSIFGLLFLALTFAPANPLTVLSDGLATRVADRVGESWVGQELGRTAAAFVVAASAAGLAVLLSLPFLLAAGASREVAFLTPEMRSTLGPLVLVHGAFLVAFAIYLYGRLDVDSRLLLVVALAAVGVVSLSQQLAVFALVGPLLVFGWLALRMDRDVGYETVLVVAGTGLVLLVELLYVKEQAGPGRMNTVFKTYMQVWVLWGTAMGAVLPGLVRGSALSTPKLRPRAVRSAVGLVLVVALVASTSVYGAFALSQHFEYNSASTLDATAFATERHPEEAEAIRWLDDQATKETTIISAPATSIYPDAESGSYPYPPGMYNWNSSPAASLTGVPTVAGWHHEVGYRGYDAYYERVRVVDAAYTGSAADLAAVVSEYDVEYVWVGPAERARYGEALTIEEMEGQGVEQAYQTEAVTVYRVDGERLQSVASEQRSES
jgi:YYY domain-containing protein